MRVTQDLFIEGLSILDKRMIEQQKVMMAQHEVLLQILEQLDQPDSSEISEGERRPPEERADAVCRCHASGPP